MPLRTVTVTKHGDSLIKVIIRKLLVFSRVVVVVVGGVEVVVTCTPDILAKIPFWAQLCTVLDCVRRQER